MCSLGPDVRGWFRGKEKKKGVGERVESDSRRALFWGWEGLQRVRGRVHRSAARIIPPLKLYLNNSILAAVTFSHVFTVIVHVSISIKHGG